jgi:hypothetical protein
MIWTKLLVLCVMLYACDARILNEAFKNTREGELAAKVATIQGNVKPTAATRKSELEPGNADALTPSAVSKGGKTSSTRRSSVRRPKNRKTRRKANWRLMLHSYLATIFDPTYQGKLPLTLYTIGNSRYVDTPYRLMLSFSDWWSHFPAISSSPFGAWSGAAGMGGTAGGSFGPVCGPGGCH